MEKRLSEAAMKGNVGTPLELLQENPPIFDKTIVSCTSETPLHEASILGHVDFVIEILSRKPELTSELDSEGCLPLHLVASKGHLKIVKELLSTDPEMGMVRNSEGRTPRHVAASEGLVKVLAELVRVSLESTRVLTDLREMSLQPCVRQSRLEGLKLLVEAMRKVDALVH